MPKTSSEHIEARRAQILEAALVCFSRDGFRNTTMRSICAEAKLSAGGVYGHFKSKDEIVEALAAKGRESSQVLLEPLAGLAPLEALATLLNKIVECLGDNDVGNRLNTTLWGESLHTPGLLALLSGTFAHARQAITELVERGQQQGEINPELDTASVARTLLAVHLGLTVQQAIEPTADPSGCTQVIEALLRDNFSRIQRSKA